jgi:hypothetical protein
VPELDRTGSPVDHSHFDGVSFAVLLPVPLKHILSVKKADGNYDKHKCRLVLCGHKGFMIAGKHYQETYSATVDTATSKLIQVLALIYGWDRASWDVDTAYLQSDSGTRATGWL